MNQRRFLRIICRNFSTTKVIFLVKRIEKLFDTFEMYLTDFVERRFYPQINSHQTVREILHVLWN